MVVFLSWSGPTSNAVARTLKAWLENVIQALKPWVSEEDIEKGRRWGPEIAAQLDAAMVGIVCITPDNQGAPWLNFEAGAISKAVPEARVWTFLHRIKRSDVVGPLAQFQSTIEEKEDVRRLLGSINKALGDRALSEQQLAFAFDRMWPDLEAALKGIGVIGEKSPERDEREMLAELLDLVREQKRMRDAEIGALGQMVADLVFRRSEALWGDDIARSSLMPGAVNPFHLHRPAPPSPDDFNAAVLAAVRALDPTVRATIKRILDPTANDDEGK